MEPKLKLVRKQNLVEPWFHGTVEHVEPQFVNLMLSNNASETFAIDSLFDFKASSEKTIAFAMNLIHAVTCMSVMSDGMEKSNEFDSLRLAERKLRKRILEHLKSL